MSKLYTYIQSVNKKFKRTLFNTSLIKYSKNIYSGTLEVDYEVAMKKQEYSVISVDLLDP